MQLCSADATIFLNKNLTFCFAPENIKNKRPQKLLIIGQIFFSVLAQKQKSRTSKSPLMQDWVFRLGSWCNSILDWDVRDQFIGTWGTYLHLWSNRLDPIAQKSVSQWGQKSYEVNLFIPYQFLVIPANKVSKSQDRCISNILTNFLQFSVSAETSHIQLV